jgi:hypothetical protein
MKFNIKQILREENSGPDGGFIGYASDAENLGVYTGKGITDPRGSIGGFGTIYQNQANFKVQKAMQPNTMDQVQSGIFSYLAGSFSDPKQALYNLKVKLNHMGLDFDVNNTTQLNPGQNTFKLSYYGEKFGTTPTNDLMKGFDRGQDYTDVILSFNLQKLQSGNYVFRDISLGYEGAAPSGEQMQAENFYNFIASDEHICEKVFKPIALNLLEKADSNELDESVALRQLTFVIERAAKYLELELNEDTTNHLAVGLFKMLFEEENKAMENKTGSDIDALARAKAKTGGIASHLKRLRDKRKAAMARLAQMAAEEKK